jgi:hypothetical protein
MTIYALFSDQAFGPEKLQRMSQAYESVCSKLGLNLADNPATQAVAEKIIQFAQRGVADVATLRSMTLQSFNAET